MARSSREGFYKLLGIFTAFLTTFTRCAREGAIKETRESQNNSNPAGGVQDNGGPTYTLRPGTGSLAIDQGKRGTDANGQLINTDQRGYPRPVDLVTPNAIGGDGSDIGAVETAAVQSGPSFTVTTTEGTDDGSCTLDDCTLGEAIAAANFDADASTITFAPGLAGLIFYGPYNITKPVTIIGPGARVLSVGNGTISRVFAVNSANVVITGLTITEGSEYDSNGGAIANYGQLTLEDCEIAGTKAVGNDPVGLGGGIYNASGAALNMTRCTIRDCTAGAYGGGVYTEGAFTATNCTVSGNKALRGGGIILRGTATINLRNARLRKTPRPTAWRVRDLAAAVSSAKAARRSTCSRTISLPAISRRTIPISVVITNRRVTT